MTSKPIRSGPFKEYLGDGAYADYDGFAVVLTAENGLEVTERVVLEPEVLREFEAYLASLRARILAERLAGEPPGAVELPTPLDQERDSFTRETEERADKADFEELGGSW